MAVPGARFVLAIAALAVCAAGLGCAQRETPASSEKTPPRRIVSLDPCADHLLLLLADRSRIVAVSQDVDKDFSPARGMATGVARVRAQAEDVLALRPDLVVRAYGGGGDATALFQRHGVRVVTVPFAATLDDVRNSVRVVGAALDRAAQAEMIASTFDRDRKALEAPPGTQPRAIYMTAGGVSAGRGTLVDEAMRLAGLENYVEEEGWRPIPLESLARRAPDIVAAAFFNGAGPSTDVWSAARHAVARRQLQSPATIVIDAASTACGGVGVLEAARNLAAAKSAFLRAEP